MEGFGTMVDEGVQDARAKDIRVDVIAIEEACSVSEGVADEERLSCRDCYHRLRLAQHTHASGLWMSDIAEATAARSAACTCCDHGGSHSGRPAQGRATAAW